MTRRGRHLTENLGCRPAAPAGCILRVIRGEDEGKQLVLPSGKATVGRCADCDLQLTDRSVSGRHVSIEVVPEGLLATDLGSTNGTFYLGTRLARGVVTYGSVLNLGRSRLLLAPPSPQAFEEYSERTSYGRLAGSGPAMRRLYAVLERIVPLDYTVLVRGETGVGKDVVAREIHAHSRRAAGPFEVCDCTVLPSTLAEGELFGHVRGAFTGAQADHSGVFERADRGTVFLDEIGELPLELQPKLLRVLEARALRRLGGREIRDIDVRIIAATSRDLEAEAHAGRFRQDLFFRLNMITVTIPPLRERREDIPILIQEFLRELGQADVSLSPATLELFTTGYDWPGNVRELRNALARAQALGELPEARAHEALPGQSPTDTARLQAVVDVSSTFQLAKHRLVEAFERDYLTAKLVEADYNISRAARAAGVERTHFRRLLRKHGLIRPDDTD